jgi:cytoskeletal protein CcmA (bactofilin family)
MALFNQKNNATPLSPGNLNIINSSTTIIGDLNSEGDMRIDGIIKGYVSSKSRLVMGPTSKIDGDIKAANLEVSGEVNGNIYVTELLTVKASAKINGDIVSNKLIIEAGAEFNGHCNMKEGKNVLKKIENTELPTSKTFDQPLKQNIVQ